MVPYCGSREQDTNCYHALQRGYQVSAERQVAYLTFPLAGKAALGQQQDIVDHRTDGPIVAYLEHAGHCQPAPTLSYPWRVIVLTSCVSRTRTCSAAHARTLASGAPENQAYWTRTMSKSGLRRNSPRRMSWLKFSSTASGSMPIASAFHDAPSTARGHPEDRNALRSPLGRRLPGPSVAGGMLRLPTDAGGSSR